MGYHSNISSGRFRSSAYDNNTPNHRAARIRYCSKCQEYWSVCNSSGDFGRQASFNHRPESTVGALPGGVNTASLALNVSSTISRSTSSYPPRPPHRRKSRTDNIDTLREELQAIHQGITRIINDLQLLSETLLTYQPTLRYAWDPRTSNYSEPTNMNVGQPRPAIEGHGSVAPQGPGVQQSSDYGVLNPQLISHPTQAPPSSVYRDAPRSFLNGQGDMNATPYRAPTTGGDFTYTTLNEQIPNFTQPMAHSITDATGEIANNEPFTTSSHTLGGSVNMPNYSQNQYGGFGLPWHGYAPSELQRHAFPSLQAAPRVSPTALYVNGTTPQVLVHPRPVLQPSGTQAMPLAAYQMMPQASVNNNVQAEAQAASNVGVRPMYTQQTLPRSNQYMHFPQSGASQGPTQSRRHHRTTSFAPNAAPASGQHHARTTSGQNGRRRTRPTDEANMQLPQIPRIQSTATTMMPNAPPPPLAEEYYPLFTPQQRAEIERRLQLDELLHSMRSDDSRALQMVEESLLHSRRYRQELDLYQSSPPPKGLDDQNDGRPEPKENDELNVNLECKICMSQLVDTVLLPCGHAILCRWCADQHMPSSRADRTRPKGQATCPMCRANVKHKFRIYLS